MIARETTIAQCFLLSEVRLSEVLVYVKCHVGMSERQPFSVLVIFVNSVVGNYKALFYAWKCTSMIMFIVGDLFIIVHRVVQSLVRSLGSSTVLTSHAVFNLHCSK